MIQKLDNEKNETAQSFPACVAEKRDTIRAITVKLQRLLDSYLDQDIDKEEYRPRKAKLLSDKKDAGGIYLPSATHANIVARTYA